MNIEKDLEKFLIERDNLLIHHPLLTGLSLIPTAQIASLCTAVLRAVLTRQLGLCFTAKSGMGKTSAMRFLATYLREKVPQLIVYNHSCRNHKGGSVRGFFKQFLTTVGHPLTKGETADLRDRLGKTIVDNVRVSGLQLAVMLIDEAQAMDIDDFTFLKDVYNEIEAEGVSLITVLMAQQPDFTAVRNRLVSSERLDLMSRFALKPQEFRAFDSQEQIAQVLGQIDKITYNEAHFTTWTEFFVPLGYSNGFRLANSAGLIFSSLSKSLEKQGLPCQIPARQLFSAIRFYLMDAMQCDSTSYLFDVESWLHSSDTAAILEAAHYASAGNSKKFRMKR